MSATSAACGSDRAAAAEIRISYGFSDDRSRSAFHHMSDSLATLAAPCSHAVEIKKSRFLAQAAPASSPEAAMAVVDSLRGNGGTAAQCLQQAARQSIVHVTRMALHCDFAQWALLEGRIRERGIAIENTIYGALAVDAILAVPSDQESDLAHLVADATQGRVSLAALPVDCH